MNKTELRSNFPWQSTTTKYFIVAVIYRKQITQINITNNQKTERVRFSMSRGTSGPDLPSPFGRKFLFHFHTLPDDGRSISRNVAEKYYDSRHDKLRNNMDIFLLQNTYRLPLTKNVLQLCPQLSLPLHIWPHFITCSHYNETYQLRQ